MKEAKDAKMIQSVEDKNTFYIELDDNLRLVFTEGVFQGWYVA